MSPSNRQHTEPRARSRGARILRPLVGLLLLVAAFGYLFLERIGWAELRETLGQFQLGYSVYILVAQASFHFLGAVALWVLASGTGPVRFFDLVTAYWRSLAVGYWTPAGIGEMSFAWFHRRTGVAVSGSLALLTVDKVVTLGVTALLGVPILWLAPSGLLQGWDVQSAVKIGTGLVVCFLVGLTGWMFWRKIVPGRRLQSAMRQYVSAVSQFTRHSPMLLAANAGVSVVRAAAATAAYWWAIVSFGGSLASSFWLFLAVVSGARVLALVLPAPNGLGVFEVALIELMAEPGTSAPAVLSGALLVRLLSLAIVTSGLALPFMHRLLRGERQ